MAVCVWNNLQAAASRASFYFIWELENMVAVNHIYEAVQMQHMRQIYSVITACKTEVNSWPDLHKLISRYKWKTSEVWAVQTVTQSPLPQHISPASRHKNCIYCTHAERYNKIMPQHLLVLLDIQNKSHICTHASSSKQKEAFPMVWRNLCTCYAHKVWAAEYMGIYTGIGEQKQQTQESSFLCTVCAILCMLAWEENQLPSKSANDQLDRSERGQEWDNYHKFRNMGHWIDTKGAHRKEFRESGEYELKICCSASIFLNSVHFFLGAGIPDEAGYIFRALKHCSETLQNIRMLRDRSREDNVTQ